MFNTIKLLVCHCLLCEDCTVGSDKPHLALGSRQTRHTGPSKHPSIMLVRNRPVLMCQSHSHWSTHIAWSWWSSFGRRNQDTVLVMLYVTEEMYISLHKRKTYLKNKLKWKQISLHKKIERKFPVQKQKCFPIRFTSFWNRSNKQHMQTYLLLEQHSRVVVRRFDLTEQTIIQLLQLNLVVDE